MHDGWWIKRKRETESTMNLTGMWEMEITIVVPKLQSYVACGLSRETADKAVGLVSSSHPPPHLSYASGQPSLSLYHKSFINWFVSIYSVVSVFMGSSGGDLSEYGQLFILWNIEFWKCKTFNLIKEKCVDLKMGKGRG